ncbi:MAG: hypothetical protein WCC64_14490 [Aliidongia sp.]
MPAIDIFSPGHRVGLTLLLVSVLCISGCAAKPPASPPPGSEMPASLAGMPALPDRLARLEGEIAALRGNYDPAAPPIERLEAIEGDLHGLVAELRAAAPPEPAAAAPATVIAATPIDPPPMVGAGGFGIHLASY